MAFFNLNDVEIAISAAMEDLDKAFPGRNISGVCKGKEIWSGKDLGEVGKLLEANVSSHGVELFVLHCYNTIYIEGDE